MTQKRFQNFCLFVLGFTLFVILWGVWVRFSHSGDGCGTEWPLCNNQFIPQQSSKKTWIEWFHRASSGLFGFIILFLVYFSFKCFPKKHKVRFWSLVALAFTISEALIGALLVLKGLTGQNTSFFRLIVLNAHLINSLMLVASVVFCWRFSLTPTKVPIKKILSIGGAYIIIALTGSMTSLSNTLFPSTSLLQGWMMDFDPNSPWLVQWRLTHPLVALTIGGSLLFFFMYKWMDKPNIWSKNKLHSWFPLSSSLWLIILLFTGIVTGMTTLLTLSPLIMRLLHVSIAYLIWIGILNLK